MTTASPRRSLAGLSTHATGPDGPRAAVALAALDSVLPPYPPVDELPPDTAVTLTHAIEHLRAAAHATTSLPEAIRLADAALELATPLGA
ncbi:MAG: hypothetical protein ACFCUP_11645 [Actinomycetales bacterium]